MHAKFLCDHTIGCDSEAYSFTTDGYTGSLMHMQILVYAIHMKGDQAKTNLHMS